MNPNQSPSFSALLFIITVLAVAVSGEESPTILFRSVCGATRSNNPQPLDVNFINAMETISKTISDTRFVISVSGSNASKSSRVYGLGQCLNYVSKTDCRLCYAKARVKLPLCLPSTSGRVYLSGCFLRYGNTNFTDQNHDDSDLLLCSDGSSKAAADKVKFRRVVTGFITNLTYAASEASDYYKEGNATIYPNSELRVYGIAVCWRSLNKSACVECLESARNMIVRCPLASEGKALNAGCFVRYSLQPFNEMFSPSNSSAKRRRRLGIALGATFAAILVVIAAAILWSIRRASMDADNFPNTEISPEMLKIISESHLSFKYVHLRNATDYFSLENKLGQGGFGSVYKGILSDGREVAVKRLFFQTTQFVDQFFNEVNLISQVQHKNLVKLLGCSVEGPESLLVYEYLSNSSLDRYLFDPLKKILLDWERRLEILIGTAEGLAYLHEASDVRIIHRDIKASNVLLDQKYKAKIADFGLARYFAEGQSHLSTGIAGTIGYMAPEYVIHGQLSEKADVYSYGVLVHEVLTGRRNANKSNAPSSETHQSLVSQIWSHFKSNTLHEALDPMLKAQCSDEEALKAFRVGLLCIQASPNLRPTMKNVVEMMTFKNRDLPLPTEPPFLNLKGMELSFGFATSETSYRYTSSPKLSLSKSSVSTNPAASSSIVFGR